MTSLPNLPSALVRNLPCDDEHQLALGAAAGCLIVGACGWFANWLLPGSTTLGGLLIVGGFYLAIAGTSCLSAHCNEDCDAHLDAQSKDRR